MLEPSHIVVNPFKSLKVKSLFKNPAIVHPWMHHIFETIILFSIRGNNTPIFLFFKIF